MCIFFEYYMTLCPPLLYCSIVLLGADMTAGPGQAPPARPLPYPLLGARLVPVLSHKTHLDTAQPAIAAAKHDVFSLTQTPHKLQFLLLLRRRRMKVVASLDRQQGKW